jgi:Tol biopolymer transport system component
VLDSLSRVRRPALAALLVVVSGVAARAAEAQGPSADWRTIETEHFRVHYPAPFEAWARHAAGLLEPVRGRVTAFVGYAPAPPIDVVVADPAADANGMALPFLDRPAIVLWTSPPAAASWLADFPDWTEILATHEVAHVVHLARPGTAAGSFVARLLPAPFGPIAFGSPRWLVEGYATLVEGALTGSGRPASSLRAMVLRRLAIEGKLPTYAKLDGGSGWLASGVPYLVGSAYLEWLAARSGEASLRELWGRMAGRVFGGFAASFEEVFGGSPEDLYGRFVAETTAQALETECRLENESLAAGELLLRLEGGTSSLQVSPDGSKLLARRDPSRRESDLAVWDATPGTEDPPLRKLPRHEGYSGSDPRWMPDSRHVLFSKRAPDAEGVLRRDLYFWDHSGERVSRVTRHADLGEADPSPGGDFAIAVRSRFGASTLVHADLATGETRELPVRTGSEDAWPIWGEPRISPDGRRIAALLHLDGRWRLVVLPVEGGDVRELPLGGVPLSAAEWSADGVVLFVSRAPASKIPGAGIPEIVSLDPDGASELRVWTRVTGGAFSPAPSPDGKRLTFLDWTARGVDVRRLEPFDLAAEPLRVEGAGQAEAAAGRAIAAAQVAEGRPYSVWPSQAVRPLLNFAIGPDGAAVQVGVDGADVLGRFHWLAAASFGNTPGPRGGTAAAAWRGFPVALSLQLFSALEIPGRQSLAPRPELDEERQGGFVRAWWSRPFTGGRFEAEVGSGAASVEALSEDTRFSRALGTTRLRLDIRRTSGRWGAGLELEAAGALGETRGLFWSQWSGGVRPAWIMPFGTLSLGGRWGGTGGSPSRFDAFAIGGSPSTILPPGFDRNRIESPALPFAVQLGTKYEAYRAAMELSGVPIVLYGEWLRAWSAGQLRPDPVRAAGAEARLERLVPAEFGRTLTFRVGAAWIDSVAPRFSTVRGYADLIYRP